MSLVQHFVTPFNSGNSNLAIWNDIAADSSPGLSIDAIRPDFRGELYRWQLPDVAMLWASARDSIVHRRPRTAEPERVLVHVQGRGRCRQSHCRQVSLLMPGDISLCTSEAGVTIETNEHDMLVLDLPRTWLEAKVEGLEGLFGRRIAGSSPSVTAFRSFLLASWREAIQMDASRAGQWPRQLQNVLIELVALALSNPSDTSQLARKDHLLAIVEAQLHDPDLGAVSLALELGVSLRTVQLEFAKMGTTARDYILIQRLARAAEALRMDIARPITAIAYDAGFNDSAYFARCFRQRYGVGPKLWRDARC